MKGRSSTRFLVDWGHENSNDQLETSTHFQLTVAEVIGWWRASWWIWLRWLVGEGLLDESGWGDWLVKSFLMNLAEVIWFVKSFLMNLAEVIDWLPPALITEVVNREGSHSLKARPPQLTRQMLVSVPISHDKQRRGAYINIMSLRNSQPDACQDSRSSAFPTKRQGCYWLSIFIPIYLFLFFYF